MYPVTPVLYQCLAFNKTKDNVELMPVGSDVSVYLETVEEGNIPWIQYYIALSVFSVLSTLIVSSHASQILMFTYPFIGNYGVSNQTFRSGGTGGFRCHRKNGKREIAIKSIDKQQPEM